MTITNNTITSSAIQASGRRLSASIAQAVAGNRRRMDLWLNLERVTKGLKSKTEPYLSLLLKLEGIPGIAIDRTTPAQEARQIIGCLRAERKGGAQGFTYEAIFDAVAKALPPSQLPPGGLYTEGALNAAVGAFLEHLKVTHQSPCIPLWLAVASVLESDGRHNSEAEKQLTEQAQAVAGNKPAKPKKAPTKAPSALARTNPVTEEEARRVLAESQRKALQAERARKQAREARKQARTSP